MVRFPDQACFIIRCKNLALNSRDCLSLCLPEETLKSVGPFYLVPMPEEVRYPTQGVNRQIPCRRLHTSLNHSCVSIGVYITKKAKKHFAYRESIRISGYPFLHNSPALSAHTPQLVFCTSPYHNTVCYLPSVIGDSLCSSYLRLRP